MLVLGILGAVAALALGIWIGIGAPGWPHEEEKPGRRRTRLDKRPVNPIQWGKVRHSSRRQR